MKLFNTLTAIAAVLAASSALPVTSVQAQEYGQDEAYYDDYNENEYDYGMEEGDYGTETELYGEELDDLEYESGEGLHEEEWYDPSDWIDFDEGIEYENGDDYGDNYDEYEYGYDEGYGYYDDGYGDDDWFYDYYDYNGVW